MLPFVTLIALMAIRPLLPPPAGYPLSTLGLAVALWFVRGALDLRPRDWLWSVLLGVLVWALWVGPDLVWPGYRSHWAFQNALMSASGGGAPAGARTSWVFLAFRVAGSVALIPIAEELFWRGWLMRWLIVQPFYKTPLGTYSARAFWITALLFASEHGAYWDVGLLAGIAYNWWLVRTRRLADCILAHAVTNGCLAVYVLVTGKWGYWM